MEVLKSQPLSKTDGIDLDNLPEGVELDVRTHNRCYHIVSRGNGHALISGHPRYCCEPILVRIEGSTWGGSALRKNFIGVGMNLQFRLPEEFRVTTSPIEEICFASKA